MVYVRSPFREFENFFRIVVGLNGLNEDDIQLILKQYNASFVTHQLDSGNYTIGDLQEAVYPLCDQEGSL